MTNKRVESGQVDKAMRSESFHLSVEKTSEPQSPSETNLFIYSLTRSTLFILRELLQCGTFVPQIIYDLANVQ